MIITGSIVGMLLPDSSIFMQAQRKDLIENTNESRVRVCARGTSTFYWMWIFLAACNTAVCRFVGARA